MFSRIIVAVNDSPAALHAARLAVTLAAAHGATLRAVAVLTDGEVAQQLPGDTVRTRQAHAADTVLHYVTTLAEKAHVKAETVCLDGEACERILHEANTWRADLIVLGRSDLPKPAQPYLGGHTRRVLEFADQPVLVVPHLTWRGAAGTGARAADPAPTGRSTP